MGSLNENSNIEELCTWLKGSEGKEWLNMVEKYGELNAIIATGANTKKVVIEEIKDAHKVLSNIQKSKELGAKVYLNELKRTFQQWLGKGHPSEYINNKEGPVYEFISKNGGMKKWEKFTNKLYIIGDIAGVK